MQVGNYCIFFMYLCRLNIFFFLYHQTSTLQYCYSRLNNETGTANYFISLCAETLTFNFSGMHSTHNATKALLNQLYLKRFFRYDTIVFILDISYKKIYIYLKLIYLWLNTVNTQNLYIPIGYFNYLDSPKARL